MTVKHYILALIYISIVPLSLQGRRECHTNCKQPVVAGCAQSCTPQNTRKTCCSKKQCSCIRPRQTRPVPAKESFITCNDVELFTSIQGQGDQTIVFIHGFPLDHTVWNQARSTLNNCFTTIAYDQRGLGKSSKSPSLSYTLETITEDLRCILDSTQTKRAIIVGHSYGSLVAMRFAFLFPERVCKLVLVSADARLVATPDFPFAVPPAAFAQLGQLFQQSLLAGLDAFISLGLPEPDTEALKQQLIQIGLQTSSATVLKSFQDLASADVRPFLASINVPTLILHGTDDRVLPVQASGYLQQHIRRSQRILFPGLGHFLFLTDPTGFSQALQNFLTDTDPCCNN